MQDYTIVVTYMDGHYEMYSDEQGKGWTSPIEALQAYFKAYPSNREEVFHVEIVNAEKEMEVYDKCESLGKELKDVRHYNETFAAELFPERYGTDDVVATPRSNLILFSGGKRRKKNL